MGEIENRLTLFVGEQIVQTVPVTRLSLCLYGVGLGLGLMLLFFKRDLSSQPSAHNV